MIKIQYDHQNNQGDEVLVSVSVLLMLLLHQAQKEQTQGERSQEWLKDAILWPIVLVKRWKNY